MDEVCATLRLIWQACIAVLATSEYLCCWCLWGRISYQVTVFAFRFLLFYLVFCHQPAGWPGSAGGYSHCPGVQWPCLFAALPGKLPMFSSPFCQYSTCCPAFPWLMVPLYLSSALHCHCVPELALHTGTDEGIWQHCVDWGFSENGCPLLPASEYNLSSQKVTLGALPLCSFGGHLLNSVFY